MTEASGARGPNAMPHHPGDHRATRAIVDLQALADNYRYIRSRLPHQTEILAVIKADAYGHGMLPVARTLQAQNVAMFGVATIGEGLVLRQTGIRTPILVMGGFGGAEDLAAARQSELTLGAVSREMLERWLALEPQTRPRMHLKFDTGMGRLGLDWREMEGTLALLRDHPDVAERLDGVMTHYAAADEPEQTGFTEMQRERFEMILSGLKSIGIDPPRRHCANTAGTLAHEPAGNLVRCGISLYGAGPSASFPTPPELKPVLRLVTSVLQVKPMQPGDTVGYGRTFSAAREGRMAVLPIGYADGIQRVLGNRSEVLVGGRRVPMIGRVSMDFLAVDVTDVPQVREGDEAVLIGAQGAERIRAEEHAMHAQTIPYEILTGIGPRVPREYREAAG